MTINSTDISMPPQFSGVVRLFPLPNLVLFPGVVQSFRIFEPRYVKMTEDTLAADQLISMCLFQHLDDAILQADEQPAIRRHVCISKVMAHKKMEDGKYNLLVVGVKRAKILRELDSDEPYRIASVELIEDELLLDSKEVDDLRSDLISTCESLNLLSKLTNQMDIKKVISSDLSLGLLVDLISFTSGLNCEGRQTILESQEIGNRCRKLIDLLKQRDANIDDSSTFPPDFSTN